MASVIESTFKLIRATKRRPHRGEHEFPPTVSHLLRILKDNDGASSRELCEYLDIRPSSMSELLARMEEHGLVERKTAEDDKRVTCVFLTEKGNDAATQIAERRAQAEAEFSACFTEEEKLQFCALADKLANHLEESAREKTDCRKHDCYEHRHGGCEHRHGGCERGHGHGRGPDRPHGPFGPHDRYR